jgi:TolB-like protein/Flp pilus assembly protein TadD
VSQSSDNLLVSKAKLPLGSDCVCGDMSTNKNLKGTNGDPWWRAWWRRFRKDFSSAEPEKQVAQVYYITAVLAVLGSLLAGLWAFGEHVWPDKSPTSVQKTSETTVTADAAPPPTLSIVALPFTNLSGDATQDYFADGITDSLTTDLSRALPGSFVVARETAFTFKGKPVDARQIGQSLHARYVLEGSVLPEGQRVRVNAHLVDAQTGNEIWAERFDTMKANILEVQDEIVGRLSRAVGLQVIDVEARRSEHQKSQSAEAIDFVLRAQAIANKPTSEATLLAARDLFNEGLKLQPDNANALAGVATTYVLETINGYHPAGNQQRLQQAETLLAKALAIDPGNIVGMKASAALQRAQGRFDDAITAAKAVIARNPGEPWAYKEVGLSLLYLGQLEQALDWFAKAERFGPYDPGRWSWFDARGQALLLLGRDEDAIRSLRTALEVNPDYLSSYAVLAAAYALKGLDEKAHTALAQYRRSNPDVTVSTFRSLSPVPLELTSQTYLKQRERLKDGLRKAGMPE